MSSRRATPLVWMAWAVAAGAVAAAWFAPAFHRLDLIAPDSASYIAFDAGRTPAYPIVLRVVPLDAVPALQLLCLAASAAWLAVEAGALLHPAAGLAIELLVLANVQYMAYAFTILPEALLGATEQALLALLFRLARTKSPANGAAIGATTLWLLLLKPSGYSFLVPIAGALWMLRVNALRVTLPAAAIVCAGLLAASALNYSRIGVFGTQAYGGYAMVGYVGQLLDESTPTNDPQLTTTIADETARTRGELERVRGLDAYYMVSSNAYHDLLVTIRRAIDSDVATREPGLDERARFVRMNAIAASLSVAAVRHRPLAYLEHAAVHWYGLWFMPLVRNASDRASFQRELEALHDRAPFTLRTAILYRELPAVAYWPFKLLLAWAFLASLAGLGAAVFRLRGEGAYATSVAGLALHANFALVAAVQTGLPRYALAMWPATVAVAVAAAWWVAGSFRPGRGGTTPRIVHPA